MNPRVALATAVALTVLFAGFTRFSLAQEADDICAAANRSELRLCETKVKNRCELDDETYMCGRDVAMRRIMQGVSVGGPRDPERVAREEAYWERVLDPAYALCDKYWREGQERCARSRRSKPTNPPGVQRSSDTTPTAPKKSAAPSRPSATAGEKRVREIRQLFSDVTVPPRSVLSVNEEMNLHRSHVTDGFCTVGPAGYSTAHEQRFSKFFNTYFYDLRATNETASPIKVFVSVYDDKGQRQNVWEAVIPPAQTKLVVQEQPFVGVSPISQVKSRACPTDRMQSDQCLNLCTWPN